MEARFLSPEQAREKYDLRAAAADKLPNEMEYHLAAEGLVSVEIPLTASDFETLSQGYAVCLDECPELLVQTAMKIDSRHGGEAGHVRKEKKINQRTGMQTSDPKNYFHFNEQARESWNDRFKRGPQILRDFLADGYEIQDALIGVARQRIADLEESHPGMSRLYFPGERGESESHTFLRLIRYDGYTVNETLGEVAKPHYDIGGATIQAYANAQGFWGAAEGVDGARKYYDTQDQKGYLFLGKGHEKVYGAESPLKPLWHGVDRIVPAGVAWVPERTAVILFIDAPKVDYHVRPQDTVPYKFGSQAYEFEPER